MSAIDLSGQLDDIRARHPQWWRSEDASFELEQLWGGDCNPHGVFVNCEVIGIELTGHSQWHGEIRLASTAKGWHAFDTSYSYSIGGKGSCPSVWSRTAYTSRDAALQAGYAQLIREFEGVRDMQGSVVPQNHAAIATRMIEALRNHRTGARQMMLF